MIPPKNYGSMQVDPSRRCPCCDAYTVDGKYYCHCDENPRCPDCYVCTQHLKTPYSNGLEELDEIVKRAPCHTCARKALQLQDYAWSERMEAKNEKHEHGFRDWEATLKETPV